jgi:hypothetical protein
LHSFPVRGFRAFGASCLGIHQRFPIGQLQIGERHRKELGDTDGLAQSISDDGLLQPIGVTPDNRLVFGYRRLAACRDNLGWAEIPTVIVDIENLTHGEWIENTIRKDLTLSEMVAITDALRSISRGGDRRSNQYRENGTGVTKKEACEIAGWKMDRFDDAKMVVENAIDELVRAMHRLHWLDPDVLANCPRIYGVYVFDRKQHFQICSFEPYHELHFLGTQYDEADELRDDAYRRDEINGKVLLGDAQCERVSYWSKADIERMLETEIAEGWLPPEGKHGG